jgi:3-oxoacyl-(acyl-carrier-protein) synthase
MKEGVCWVSTNITLKRLKLSRPGDLASGSFIWSKIINNRKDIYIMDLFAFRGLNTFMSGTCQTLVTLVEGILHVNTP